MSQDLRPTQGQLLVVVSPGGRVPPMAAGWREVRVNATMVRGGLSAVLVSERLARALLPTDTHSGPAHWDRVRLGLRRTLLGDEPVGAGAGLVAAFDTLAAIDPRPLVWVIECAHKADADSRAWVARQVRHMGHWPLAVVVGVAPEDPWGEGITALAQRLEAHGKVLDLAHVEDPEPDTTTQPLAETWGEAGWAALPVEVRTVLRAASVFGDVFEMEVLAELLELPAVRVAWLVQCAVEGGVAVIDHGGGALSLAHADRVALRDGILPSVKQLWHSRLAALMQARAPAAHSPAMGATADERHARVAEQHMGAGERKKAVLAQLDAAEAARRSGAVERAVQLLDQADQLAEGLDAPVWASISVARARLTFSSAGQGHSLRRALRGAIDSIDSIDVHDAPQQYAEARQLAAAIAYDIGDDEHLELALGQLTDGIRTLQAAGHARLAASLLNDQAAVWVRLGDYVRASHLIEESRKVFGAEASALDRSEQAESWLLLARLPLHVDARPGRRTEAVDVALQHAEAARRLWMELGDEQHAALAVETAGRLLLLDNRPRDAQPLLDAAYQVQQRLRDVLGLARTTDALANCLGMLGQVDVAVRLLGESMRLNSASGAVRGLVFNRETASRLLAWAPAEGPLHERLVELGAERLQEGKGMGVP